ncbi:hypothetical protein EVAR_93679_1 [Eumeta japonica]|uniref:Uncharacterized protein n=1 Tax=Eumeta variegata TaxID=151549 RepID=A0A4C1TQQ4_EUMVA|nr:hypothetical protein EVAR_93679_1 [Eumeta japonica]
MESEFPQTKTGVGIKNGTTSGSENQSSRFRKTEREQDSDRHFDFIMGGATRILVVNALRGQSCFGSSHQCVADLLGRNKIFYGGMNGLIEKGGINEEGGVLVEGSCQAKLISVVFDEAVIKCTRFEGGASRWAQYRLEKVFTAHSFKRRNHEALFYGPSGSGTVWPSQAMPRQESTHTPRPHATPAGTSDPDA